MIITVNINIPSPLSLPPRQLPSQLIQFGTEGLILVELQGALEVEGGMDGQLVGKLRVDPSTKKPTLMIGHHLLEGKLVNLAKPLAVMHRVDDEVKNEEAAMDVDDSSSEERHGSAKPKSWDIVAVVKKKMVFAKRPMPVVAKISNAAPLSRTGNKV